MRSLRPALVLAFVTIAVLVGSTTLAHAHDTSSPGFYNSQCPLQDLGGHAAAQLPTREAGTELAPAGSAAGLGRDQHRAEITPSPASPRAPPLV